MKKTNIFASTGVKDLFKVLEMEAKMKHEHKKKKLYDVLKTIDFGTFVALSEVILQLSDEFNLEKWSKKSDIVDTSTK